MSTPLEVFCCYAREDQEMLTHLKKHLVPLERQGLITIWSDTNLNAGVEWENELHQHLERADIILLLISPDFMISDYCYSTEMRRAIARHNEGNAQVIPILLRSTFWQNAPFAKLQMVPTNAKPVTSWPDRDDALYDITMQVKQIASQLHIKRAPVETGESTLGQQTSDRKTAPTPLATNVKARQTIVPLQCTLSDRPKAIKLLRTLTSHTNHLRGVTWSVAWSADGKVLASGGNDQTIKLWNAQTGQLLRTLTGHTEGVRSVTWSAGRTLASGGNDQTIKLWNAQTSQLLRTLTGHTKSVSSVAWSAAGQVLASGSSDGTIKLWNVQTGQVLHTLTGHTSSVMSVAWSTDGLTLASGGSDDQTIKLWNVQTGQLLHTLTGHTSLVESVVWSTDGLTLVSGSDDQTVKLWNAQTGQLLRTLIIDHTSFVSSVAWSADGITVASGSLDNTIKLWNMQTGQLLRTLTGPRPVYCVAWSADGRTLASGNDDQTISIWGMKE